MKIAKYSCFAIGTALLLAALFLVLHNVNEDKESGEQAVSILSELRSEIPEPAETEPFPEPTEYDLYAEFEEPTAPEIPTLELDGNVYIGIITIPDLRIELPVMSAWSYPNLKISPCCYEGSAEGGNLIIAAHNYRSHFGRIGELHSGAELIFTDVSGKIYTYEITGTEQIPGTAIEQMQFGAAEDWDLSLFTCTLSGQSRVTVRAVRTGERA